MLVPEKQELGEQFATGIPRMEALGYLLWAQEISLRPGFQTCRKSADGGCLEVLPWLRMGPEVSRYGFRR